MEEKVKILLSTAVVAGSENKLSSDEIREWLAEYLSSHDDEMREFPETAAEPHFDLVMADYDLSKKAMFVVAVFSKNVVSLAAGRGLAFDVRKYVESEFPDDAMNIIPEMAGRFEIGQVLSVSKSELDRWLQIG